MSANERKAGITAIQNTVVKLLTVAHIRRIASNGPTKAPMVSSDWRRPKLAPRTSAGEMSAISASRGAPRMPLPMRSMKRAAMSQETVGASGNTGLVKAASP